MSEEGVKGLDILIRDFSFKVTGNWGVPHPQTERERGDASVITRAAVLRCGVECGWRVESLLRVSE